MTAVDDLANEMRAAHSRYVAAIADLDEATLETEPAVGDWPIRDLTAHLTGWIDALLEAATHGLGGPEPTHSTITDFDAFNAGSVAAARELRWPEVLAALDAAVDRAVEYMAGLTADDLAVELTAQWGQRITVGQTLAILPHHHDEHLADVERWLESRRG